VRAMTMRTGIITITITAAIQSTNTAIPMVHVEPINMGPRHAARRSRVATQRLDARRGHGLRQLRRQDRNSAGPHARSFRRSH
jgi:hypothetical protein